jgi:hypothetical protein
MERAAAAALRVLEDQRDSAWRYYRRAEAECDVLKAERDALLAGEASINPLHHAAHAFWTFWNENGETHRHGYYESTWGAINAAIRTVGVVPHVYTSPKPAWHPQLGPHHSACDALAARLKAERDEHKRWRESLADKLHEVEGKRDALAARLKEAEGLLREAREEIPNIWSDGREMSMHIRIDAYFAADAKPDMIAKDT